MSFKESLLKNVDDFQRAQDFKRHVFLEISVPEVTSASKSICEILKDQFFESSKLGRYSQDVNLSELARRHANTILALCSDDYGFVLHSLTYLIEDNVKDHFRAEGLTLKDKSFHTTFTWIEV